MKTSIWAACPKCQSELKIETDETELVQIECPDCHKVFAAKVPPRSAAPQRDVFAQAPILPPFQPAHVHYQSRPNRSRSQQSDDSLHPLALTALIVVCAAAILLPLGFGAYYVYGKLTETDSLAMGGSSGSSNSTNMSAPPANTSQNASPASSSSGGSSAAGWPGNGFNAPGDFGSRPSMAQPDPSMPPTDNNSSTLFGAPPGNSFPAPQLNPPPITRPDSSPPSSAPGSVPGGMPGSVPDPTMNFGAPGSSSTQVTVTGPGTGQSGLSTLMQRFAGPQGVLIFVINSRGKQLAMTELTRALAVQDSFVEFVDDHTTIGIKYSGALDNVVKQIQFGRVSFVDEDSRTIHVDAN